MFPGRLEARCGPAPGQGMGSETLRAPSHLQKRRGLLGKLWQFVRWPTEHVRRDQGTNSSSHGHPLEIAAGVHVVGNPGRTPVLPLPKVAIMWFRNDLRLHDQPALLEATAGATALLPVYILDSASFGTSADGFPRLGNAGVQFLLDSVQQLRQRLQVMGSNLIVRVGEPANLLASLVAASGATDVYCHEDFPGKCSVLGSRVKQAVGEEGARWHALEGSGTLFCGKDLPFNVSSVPSTYQGFREAVAKRPDATPLPTAECVANLPSCAAGMELGELPTVQELTSKDRALTRSAHMRRAPALIGGEQTAIDLLAEILRKDAQVTESSGYSNMSCQPLSPWLDLGCITPKKVLASVSEYLKARAESGKVRLEYRKDGAWGAPSARKSHIYAELVWRDFFKAQSRARLCSRESVKSVSTRPLVRQDDSMQDMDPFPGKSLPEYSALAVA